MIGALGVLASGILLAIALLHVYWVAGGRWGVAVSLPEEFAGGGQAFTPPPVATLGVAVALVLAVLVLLGRLGLWGGFLPAHLFSWGAWGVALAFVLRSVGDFKYFGLLKKVRGTRFARWDDRLFSPLCLFLGFAATLVALG